MAKRDYYEVLGSSGRQMMHAQILEGQQVNADKELIDEVMRYGRIEETGTIYLSMLKNEEK